MSYNEERERIDQFLAKKLWLSDIPICPTESVADAITVLLKWQTTVTRHNNGVTAHWQINSLENDRFACTLRTFKNKMSGCNGRVETTHQAEGVKISRIISEALMMYYGECPEDTQNV